MYNSIDVLIIWLQYKCISNIYSMGSARFFQWTFVISGYAMASGCPRLVIPWFSRGLLRFLSCAACTHTPARKKLYKLPAVLFCHTILLYKLAWAWAWV